LAQNSQLEGIEADKLDTFISLQQKENWAQSIGNKYIERMKNKQWIEKQKLWIINFKTWFMSVSADQTSLWLIFNEMTSMISRNILELRIKKNNLKGKDNQIKTGKR
jgi:hypothetical protein